jgi:prolyl-tRNA synthetase
MRMTESFGRTLRQAPAGYDPSTAYALRAALVRLVEEKIVFLPFGLRVANNICRELLSVDDEIEFVGLPHDVDKDEWAKVIDDELQSYRQLPLRLLSKRSLFSSNLPRGLARPRWASGLQWIFASISPASQDELRQRWLDQIDTRLGSLGIASQRVEWRENAVGWVYVCDFGPEALLACSSCSYTASQEIARFLRRDPVQEEPQPLEIVSTPGADTIDSLAKFLNIPQTKTLKAVFLHSDQGSLVLALIRGDLEISLEKLEGILDQGSLVPASRKEIEDSGAVPGYASPINLQVRNQLDSEGVLVVADPSIEHGANFASGANQAGFHYTGVNYPRDFEVTLISDIAMAKAGDRCPLCGELLKSSSGIYLGGWEDFDQALQFSDENGDMAQGLVSTGTLYLEPILAAFINVYHQDGVAHWPARLAPYDVYLVDLRSPQETQEVYEALTRQDLSVLLDDRDASPGVKFTDADLIGCFTRITVSKRNLEKGGVELVCDAAQKQVVLPIDAVGAEAAALKNKFM